MEGFSNVASLPRYTFPNICKSSARATVWVGRFWLGFYCHPSLLPPSSSLLSPKFLNLLLHSFSLENLGRFWIVFMQTNAYVHRTDVSVRETSIWVFKKKHVAIGWRLMWNELRIKLFRCSVTSEHSGLQRDVKVHCSNLSRRQTDVLTNMRDETKKKKKKEVEF